MLQMGIHFVLYFVLGDIVQVNGKPIGKEMLVRHLPSQRGVQESRGGNLRSWVTL